MTTAILGEFPAELESATVATRDPGRSIAQIVALLPAHNEEAAIADAVHGLRQQTRPPDRIIVVADNCTDNTELLAVAAGAEVTVTAGNKSKKAGAAASGDSVTSPMQGTIVKVVVEEGQEVAEGDTVVVMEAMKMEQPLKAHKAGTVTGLDAEVGATVTSGAVICELKD